MLHEKLVEAASDARLRAYAPYSNFRVGAALLGADGSVFVGCNVENVSLGLTICAERSAVFAAVSQGCVSFQTIAIVAESKQPIAPCGACRQVLAEFAPDLEVVSANLEGKFESARLAELLPHPKRGILDL